MDKIRYEVVDYLDHPCSSREYISPQYISKLLLEVARAASVCVAAFAVPASCKLVDPTAKAGTTDALLAGIYPRAKLRQT